MMELTYEHASTVLTSNKGFEEWANILGDEVMAAALTDRLMHHTAMSLISAATANRMREHTDPWHAIQPKADEQPTARPTKKKEIKSH